MRFPYRFRQVHADKIFAAWMKADQPPYIRIIPVEPLAAPTSFATTEKADAMVTVITARCWNDRGVMRFEPATPADLAVAEDWEKRHRDTESEAFTWLPTFPVSEAEGTG